MTIHVWQRTVSGRDETTFPEGFEHVATLDDVDDLDVAFSRTQHIDEAWTKRPGVTMHVDPAMVRSTMVGDVFTVEGAITVVHHMIAPEGFRKITRRSKLASRVDIV